MTREVFRGSRTHCTLGVGCDETGVCYADAHGDPSQCGINIVDVLPDEPSAIESVWYRGWECGWNDTANAYTGEGWEAYKGGCDLDAPRINTKTWEALIDAIDEAEEDEL